MPPICDGRGLSAICKRAELGALRCSCQFNRDDFLLGPALSRKLALPGTGQACEWKSGDRKDRLVDQGESSVSQTSMTLLTNSNESGIIYCLSKKDAETVADELSLWSGGQIKVRNVSNKGSDRAKFIDRCISRCCHGSREGAYTHQMEGRSSQVSRVWLDECCRS